MIRVIGCLCLMSLFISGCLIKPSDLPPTETAVPMEELIISALAETQDAEKGNFSATIPYSPLELAELLVPGDALEGEWKPSTAYDLTQPIPGFPCGEGYYGTCWNDWPGVADYGVELILLSDGEEMGKAVFMYYQDLDDIEAIYQAFNTRWTESKAEEEESYNDIWLHFNNALDTSDLGQKSQNRVGYGLYEPDDRELLAFQIELFRCHGYVHIELRFIPETHWQDKDTDARLQEQDSLFQIVHEYAQEVDQRITLYACRP